MSRVFTVEEVAKHNKQGDLWVIIDSRVYDLSKFCTHHPGGQSVLLDKDIAGKDATEAFFGLHRYEIIVKAHLRKMDIGSIAGAKQRIFPRAPGALSMVPYAEPTWLSQGYHSPYYKDHHRKFQVAFRKFIDEVVLPDVQACEEENKRPSQHVFEEMARLNIIAMRFGPGPHLRGLELMGGIVKPEEFDAFHDLILLQEMSRYHARGYQDGIGGGTTIGIPPVLAYATPAVRERVVKEILSGKKHAALAISEAFAGSDVAGIRCFAKRVENGWRVTGTKKWITNGTFADYFIIGARTEQGGLVALIVERGEGVATRPIQTAYSAAAGTAYVTFENVFVPAENILGEANKGLQVILANFNHERFGMAANCISAQRLIVEECMKWVNQRKVFGKPLHSQAIVRSRLAAMISRVESAQAWIENITYQMCNMNYAEQSSLLAGQIALLKRYATSTAQKTAADAVQIFGGRGITKTGMGRHIEQYHRTVPFDAILGGAEDVLADLGVRQALRKMPTNTRL